MGVELKCAGNENRQLSVAEELVRLGLATSQLREPGGTEV